MIDQAAVPGTSNTEDSPLNYWKARAEKAEAALERLSPASGGVSGEDGELIARTREIIADAPLDFPDDAPELQLIRNAETLCARLSALLAERDGLRAEVGLLKTAWKNEAEKDPLYGALSASNAALAEAVGLLAPLAATAIGPEIIDDRDLILYMNAGRSIAVGDVLDARAFLAKHGKTEEAKT